MNKNKCYFISINSIFELTGGGIYARTILNALKYKYSEIVVINKKIELTNESKKEYNGFIVQLEKTKIADIVSRIFISPSFLFFYITSIIAEIKKNRGECVDLFFHNSRLGIVALILK
ncbi:glycosyltransferase family 1 protein, partial [Escherichia coli]|nr:glycosyltransferase family 1 protein [Escherichia coli]